MRVAVDGFHLWGPSRDRGIGRYVTSLVSAVAARGDVDVVVTTARDLDLPDTVEQVVVRRRRGGPAGFVQHAGATGRELAATGADVAHLPGLPPPIRLATPWAITVHDLFPVELPHTSNRRQRGLVRLSLPRVRQAPGVVAPSQATADALVRHGVPAHRVHVVRNAVDPRFRPDGPVRRSGAPYVLLVANADPRKQRHVALLAQQAVLDAGLPHRLAVVGRLDPEQRRRFHDEVAALGLTDVVEDLDHVDDLAAVYRGADAVIVPSAGEGFGYPAVEAMACGTPVVAFRNSATAEVVGTAGALVPDGDVATFGATLVDLLGDEAARTRLVRAGLLQAARYPPSAFADGLVAVWERLASAARWAR